MVIVSISNLARGIVDLVDGFVFSLVTSAPATLADFMYFF